jgi:HSP20 family molecular chaperone IbpA
MDIDIRPKVVVVTVGAHSNLVKATLSHGTLTMESNGREVVVADVVEMSRSGDVEIDVGGNRVVVTGSRMPNITDIMDESCRDTTSYYEEERAFHKRQYQRMSRALSKRANMGKRR